MARLVYLLQGYFHASSDGASSCSSSASSSLWTWDTEKALYPKGLKETLRAEHRRTPRGSSGRLRRSDLRDYKFAFVITNSSYCKSLAQANNVVSTIPRVFPPPLHVACRHTPCAIYTKRWNLNDCLKQGPRRRSRRRSRTIQSAAAGASPWDACDM